MAKRFVLLLFGCVGLLIGSLGATFALFPALPAGAQGGATISCDKSTVQIGSGTAGQAYCNLAGFAPNELLIATSPDPRFTSFSFNVGSAGTGFEYIYSNDCSEIPETLTVTTTGQTSHLSVSAAFTLTLPKDPSCGGATTGMAATPDGGGYWLTNAAGGVSTHGNAVDYGSMAGQHLNAPVNHIVSTPDGKGYWLVAADGGTFAFGDAGFFGSTGSMHLNAPVVDIAPTSDGQGYWLVASDGGIFSYGDAQFHGSMGGQPLNKAVVGISADDTTGGYWEVATDGGIFAFGAPFYGSTGNIHLNKPVNGMTATANDGGYWFVASDGGIFAYGNAQFYGSTGAITLNAPIVGMATDSSTGGYWLVASDGGIFSYNAPFYGAG